MGGVRTVAIIQCRLDSTRLPGKALRELAGRPLIGHLVDRLRQVRGLDEIGLAIGDAPDNAPLVTFARHEGLRWVIGSEENVLWRFMEAVKVFEADIVLRATPDCCLWAPDLGGQVLAALRQGFEYVHNTRPGVDGFDAEAFTPKALEWCWHMGSDREHVTSWLRSTEACSFLPTAYVQQAEALWHLKLSIDTEEDWTRVAAIFAHLPPNSYGWQDTLAAAQAAGLA